MHMTVEPMEATMRCEHSQEIMMSRSSRTVVDDSGSLAITAWRCPGCDEVVIEEIYILARDGEARPRRIRYAVVTALGRKRQAAGTPVVNAVLQDVANKLAAVDSQKLKRALDAIQ